MTIATVDWALKQPIGKSSLKFVLVALSNYSGPSGECYPSIPTLAFDTGQNEKTVRANLRELVKQNYIVDTGKRVGRTKQIPIFMLSPYAVHLLNPPKNGSLPAKGPKNGRQRLPKTDLEPYQKRYPEPAIEPVTEPNRLKERSQSEEQRARNAAKVAELVSNMTGWNR